MLKKNDVLETEIIDLTQNGEGIGKADGFPLFIKHAVPGDIVNATVTKLKKNYGYGHLNSIVKASPERVKPACPVYRRCGGCQLQNMNYEAQLEFKQNKVRNCLERIGGFKDVPMERILPSPETLRYRNKAQFPVGTDREGRTVCGFYAGRTHEIIPCSDCLICPEKYSEVVSDVIKWMDKHELHPYDERSGSGLVRHIFIRSAEPEGRMNVCLIINADELPHKNELAACFRERGDVDVFSFCVNKRRDNVILDGEIRNVFELKPFEERIGELHFEVSEKAFFQINTLQMKNLYDKAIEYAGFTGSEVLWDLYCGIGTISSCAAAHVRKVIGIEVVEEAIVNAKANAERNNIRNAEFYAGEAETLFEKLVPEKGCDAVILDPPRKGCDRKLLDTLLKVCPGKIVYVSCDPATLARDLKILCESRYELIKVCPADMFPQTTAVESCALLERSGDS